MSRFACLHEPPAPNPRLVLLLSEDFKSPSPPSWAIPSRAYYPLSSLRVHDLLPLLPYLKVQAHAGDFALEPLPALSFGPCPTLRPVKSVASMRTIVRPVLSEHTHMITGRQGNPTQWIVIDTYLP
jgi:hypothetical protein